MAGSDQLRYSIPLDAINGTPDSVRVSLEYQAIPPAYLAARFKAGQTSTIHQAKAAVTADTSTLPGQ
ncbi:MAG: hypothetical protein JKY92_06465 [Magnetovibrio sp.]|nr:hypothetical protein [Magnetovibrio sp.]